MAFASFLKNIFSNPNKKQNQNYSNTTITSANEGSYLLTETNFLKIPEFISAIDMIANDIAAVKFRESKIRFWETQNYEYNEIVKGSNWNYLLNKFPNDFQSGFEFWKTNIFNFFIRGAFFFYIYKDAKNRPLELIPIHPNSIKKIKDDDDNYAYQLSFFESTNPFKEVTKINVPYKDIFSMYVFDLENISDLTFKNVYYSLIEQIGLKNQFDLIQLNQSPRLISKVKVPRKMEKNQKEELRKELKTFFDASKKLNTSATLITDEEWDIEFIDNAKSQIKSAVDPDFVKNLMVKLANAFHIPLPKLNIVDTGQSFYKSREGINIDYVNEAIKPLLDKIISKLNSIIFQKSATKEFIYDIKKLIEVDFATKGSYTNQMRQNGILSTNELRLINGYAPIKNGDKLLGNGTLVDINQKKSDFDKPPPSKENDEEGGEL